MEKYKNKSCFQLRLSIPSPPHTHTHHSLQSELPCYIFFSEFTLASNVWPRRVSCHFSSCTNSKPPHNSPPNLLVCIFQMYRYCFLPPHPDSFSSGRVRVEIPRVKRKEKKRNRAEHMFLKCWYGWWVVVVGESSGMHEA